MGFLGRCGLILLPLCGAALAQEQPEPVFRVNVRLVRMLVTVKNPMGQLVGGLNRDDFLITDNEVPQQITLFERHTERPLSIALLVDTSRSTEIEKSYELKSVRAFVRALVNEGNDQDSLALFSFNTDVTQETPFTRNLGRVDAGLRRLRSEGGTSLYDAVYLASHQLESRDGRHVVVVVSDGGDTVSRTKFVDALKALHDSDAVLYSVLVVPVSADAGRNLGGENALTEFSNWTGGRMFMPAAGADLDRAFEEILRDLRTQYLIGYYPRNVPPSRDPFHRVHVEVRREGHTVTARNGYFSDVPLQPVPGEGPKPRW